jgi:2-dehydropantoate 2-reductase
MTDMRKRPKNRETSFVYRPDLTDSLEKIDSYDAVIVSVKSNQLIGVLSQYEAAFRKVPVLLAQNIGLNDYAWLCEKYPDNLGFIYPFLMGGGRNGNNVDCAIFAGPVNHFAVGNFAGKLTPVETAFVRELRQANLKPVFYRDIIGYLKLHYVWATVLVASMVKSGGFDGFIQTREIQESYKAMCECFAVFKKEGIDSKKMFPYWLYHWPSYPLALYSRGIYGTPAMRTMMVGHVSSSPDEMKVMFASLKEYCKDRLATMKHFSKYLQSMAEYEEK